MEKIISFFFVIALLLISSAFLTSCKTSNNIDYAIHKEDPYIRYLKYNIHASLSDEHAKASYTGYYDKDDNHFIIPIGTLVHFPSKNYKWKGNFSFIIPETEINVDFEFNKNHMKMSENEYIELITSDVPISIENFSNIDQKGISNGAALNGMTKDGVLAALGYPPLHRTPSLDSSNWIYWRNPWEYSTADSVMGSPLQWIYRRPRYETITVVFDTNGYVYDVVQEDKKMPKMQE